MRCLDELHTEYPFYGNRELMRHLWREGVAVGRHRIQRLQAEVSALGVASRRSEKLREAGGHTRRHEHPPHLPGASLRRKPREPHRELAVGLAYDLGVVRREEAPDVAVHRLDPPEVAVERHRVRSPPHSSRRWPRARPAHRPAGRTRSPRRNRPSPQPCPQSPARGHHRVAPGEIVPLRAPDPAPRRIDRLGSRRERHGHRRVRAVELAEQVSVRLAGRREERVEDRRLSVQPEIAAPHLDLGEREPPVHPAPHRSVPRRVLLGDQLGEEPRRIGGPEDVDRRVLGDERPARVYQRLEAAGGSLDLRTKVCRRALQSETRSDSSSKKSGSCLPMRRTSFASARAKHARPWLLRWDPQLRSRQWDSVVARRINCAGTSPAGMPTNACLASGGPHHD